MLLVLTFIILLTKWLVEWTIIIFMSIVQMFKLNALPIQGEHPGTPILHKEGRKGLCHSVILVGFWGFGSLVPTLLKFLFMSDSFLMWPSGTVALNHEFVIIISFCLNTLTYMKLSKETQRAGLGPKTLSRAILRVPGLWQRAMPRPREPSVVIPQRT